MSDGLALTFWPQSSDALDYLDTGRKCAESGQCFDALRPMISNLWFSLPYRLGVPPESLLVVHALLLSISVILAAAVLVMFAKSVRPVSMVYGGLVLCISVAIHTFFLWPTFFHSLSDTPAAALLLIAIECVLLVHVQAVRDKPLFFLVAGLLFGLAIGLRVFYLYPVLLAVAVYVLVSVALGNTGGRRVYHSVWLCVLLIPVLLQMCVTWQQSRELAYLPQAGTQFWRNLHQNSPYIGYDTLMPEESYPWMDETQTCDGLWPAVEQRNWRGLWCTVSGRFYFLFGSDSRQTYVQTDRVQWDYLSVDPRIQSVGLGRADWPFERTQGGGRLHLAGEGAGQPYRIVQEIWLDVPGPVTVNLTARDASGPAGVDPSYLALRVEQVDGHLLAQHWLALGKQLQRHHWHLSLDHPGRYVVVVATSPEKPAPTVLDAGDFTVQTGVHTDPYPLAPERIRRWSPVWLGVQCAALAAVLWALACRVRVQPAATSLVLLPLLILAQSLLIIPEQRFIVVPEILLWLAVFAVCQPIVHKSRYH